MTYQRLLILIIFIFTWQSDAFAQVRLGKTEVGTASFYSHRFNGKKTSFGEIHQNHELTAAHRTYPHNTMLEVKNLANNKTVIVRVADRGPYSRNRLVDISKEAAHKLDMVRTGVAKVAVRVVGMEGIVLLGNDESVDPTLGQVISLRSE
jgi:rare lipoprotein A